MKEALLYEKIGQRKVRCSLCAHRCIINDGRRGLCAVRENRSGTLYSLVYGRICSTAVDPIEKKPLFHFLPGSKSLSLSTVGCNFTCMHCQNASISQYPKEHMGGIIGTNIKPEQVVEAALRENCSSISYTYTEPTIYLEFALDCARLAHEKGIKNVFVSNGFMTLESAGLAVSHIDGNNIDLKGDDTFYKEVCGAALKPVKDTIRMMMEKGVWVEVTTLIIPGLNDSNVVLQDIAEYIRSLDPAIPWHVTAFHPIYKLYDRGRTPVESLHRARKIGMEAGLKYIYVGNVYNEGGENTYCPRCNAVLIKRKGFSVEEDELEGSQCPHCDTYIEGVWHVTNG